jgi:hypothetical protein
MSSNVQSTDDEVGYVAALFEPCSGNTTFRAVFLRRYATTFLSPLQGSSDKPDLS